MGATNTEPKGPDLAYGVELLKLEDGVPFAGQYLDEQVLVVRLGEDVFAVGATCTHYSGPLAEGIVVGEEIRCPWHHACFSLRTGDTTGAPALNPIPRYMTTIKDGVIRVTGRHEDHDPLTPKPKSFPLRSIVIVGAGAAGSAAAEELRRQGYDAEIVMIDPDAAAPYDRPNLSKDYLAGNAPEEWIPIRPPKFYEDHNVRRMARDVQTIDAQAKTITLSDNTSIAYDAVLIATGAEPIRPPIPGIDLPHVRVLRSFDDCKSIIAAVTNAKNVLIAGASFIGMETAASLRARGVSVKVVAPEMIPFAKVLGPTIGGCLKTLHEEHGVEFRLGRTVESIDRDSVTLDDGSRIDADVVILGIGVRPRVGVAERAGVPVDHGILVNEFMETSVPGIFAAGDVARYPDRASATNVRIEHWRVAQSQGRAAARNMLGGHDPFVQIPFFWTTQYDMTINYVGHAEDWTRIQVDGSPEARDCSVSFLDGDRLLAFVTIGRDVESLKIEREMETRLP